MSSVLRDACQDRATCNYAINQDKLGLPQQVPVAKTAGLYYTVHDNYMNDDINWFNGKPLSTKWGTTNNNGYSSDFSNTQAATNNYVPCPTTSMFNGQPYCTMEYFSVQWFGYLYVDWVGRWTFWLSSDDCSYFWVGPEAVSGASTSGGAGNAALKNVGLHAPQELMVEYSFSKKGYYPIRFAFGQNAGLEAFKASFMRPFGTKSTNWAGYVFASSGTQKWCARPYTVVYNCNSLLPSITKHVGSDANLKTLRLGCGT